MPLLPPRSADDNSRRFIGLDLAKKESQLALLNHAGELICSLRFPTNREVLSKLASELCPDDCVAMEVTTNSYAVARLLSSSRAKLILSNPIKTRVIAEAKIKTDKIDAKVLAELARVEYLPEVWMPDTDTEALRHLFTDRRSLVDRRTELKNSLHSILHRNLIENPHSDLFGTSGRAMLNQLCDGKDDGCDGLDRLRLRAILLELDRLEASLNELECVIASMIVERPEWRARLDRLLTIPGVSLVVGAGLLAAIGDIKRFAAAKNLAAYFGLVPSTYQSGDTKARHGRITKSGRADARWLAVEAAEHLRQAPGPLRALYTRVCAKRGHNVAVVAVARKLAELVWHLLNKEQDYIYSIPRLTQDKRARVRQMARRATGRKAPSAANRPAGRAVLYGSGLQGRKLTGQIAQQAAQQAERIYEAVIESKHNGSRAELIEGFDPLRPKAVDWQKVLEKVADNIGGAISKGKKKEAKEATEERGK